MLLWTLLTLSSATTGVTEMEALYGKTIQSLSDEYGIPYSTLQRRLSQGQTIEQAVNKDQTGGQCKLTKEQAKHIRENPDRLTAAKLAEQFNVHVKTIESIRSFRTWKKAK